MNQNNSTSYVLNCAMIYGTSMGLFWILKFMLIPFIFSVPFTSFLFLGLTIAVPFLGHHFTRQYRNRYCPNGQLSFMQAWLFGIMMYAFAALLTAVAHYIFFQYIDNGEMIATYSVMLDELPKDTPELSEMVSQYQQAADLIASMPPIELTIQLLTSNVMYGGLFALLTAFILSKKRSKEG